MKNFFIITAIVVASFLYFPNEESLKDKFENDFLIGATINQEDYQIVDRDAQAIKIVQKDFNAVTPENSMKWMHIHPEFNEFTFSNAKGFLKFLERPRKDAMHGYSFFIVLKQCGQVVTIDLMEYEFNVSMLFIALYFLKNLIYYFFQLP